MKTEKRKKLLSKSSNSSEVNNLKFCSIRVGENLFNRINRHIHILKKYLDSSYSRNRWINEAIKYKLAKEIQGNIIFLDKHLNARIDEKVLNMINQQVTIMKKYNRSFSKQKWFVEALSEKLEEDEQSPKKRLDALIAASKKQGQPA